MSVNIILEPIITEKVSTLSDEHNQYAFRVHPSATKPVIAKAIKEFFGVDVTAVRTVNQAPRRVRRGRHYGTVSGWKKAYVSVKKGQAIELESFTV